MSFLCLYPIALSRHVFHTFDNNNTRNTWHTYMVHVQPPIKKNYFFIIFIYHTQLKSKLQHHCSDSDDGFQRLIGILLFLSGPLDRCHFVVNTVKKTRVGRVNASTVLLHNKTGDWKRKREKEREREKERDTSQRETRTNTQ